jgi:hypothetical protein
MSAASALMILIRLAWSSTDSSAMIGRPTAFASLRTRAMPTSSGASMLRSTSRCSGVCSLE